MVFTIVANEGKARAGVLQTKSGSIETPFFMPVATKSTVKHISSLDLEQMRAPAIICNSYILSLKPGKDAIQQQKGIGKFMAFPGVVFTDSGGFQMYSQQLYLGSTNEGVTFRNPFSGERKFMTPEAVMELQLALNSDVAMCLDSMPLIEESKDSIAEAVRKTTLWAVRCKAHHDTLQTGLPHEKRQLLFGIIQGGIHADLRERSAHELVALSFDGYSIGGLALGEAKEDQWAMIEVVKNVIPAEKPVYLMGVGSPQELVEAIARGVDMFDSRFPTQNARHGNIFTSEGKLRLLNTDYKLDARPLDPQCDCFVCKKYTRMYLRHLLEQEEGTGMRLASFHTLYYLQTLMRDARKAIIEGRFAALKDHILQLYSS